MNTARWLTASRVVAWGGTVLATALLAGCGGGGSAPAAAPAGASVSSSAGAGFTAYRDCLQQHGVTLPSRAPGRGLPSGSPGAGGGFGGFGGGAAGGGGFSQSPEMRAAMQACAALRPAGGAFGGGRGGTAIVAFRNCMTQQGVTVPTARPTAPAANPPAPGSRFLAGLDPNDPKVAAALKVCSPLLPTRSPAAQPSGTPTS